MRDRNAICPMANQPDNHLEKNWRLFDNIECGIPMECPKQHIVLWTNIYPIFSQYFTIGPTSSQHSTNNFANWGPFDIDCISYQGKNNWQTFVFMEFSIEKQLRLNQYRWYGQCLSRKSIKPTDWTCSCETLLTDASYYTRDPPVTTVVC